MCVLWTIFIADVYPRRLLPKDFLNCLNSFYFIFYFFGPIENFHFYLSCFQSLCAWLDVWSVLFFLLEVMTSGSRTTDFLTKLKHLKKGIACFSAVTPILGPLLIYLNQKCLAFPFFYLRCWLSAYFIRCWRIISIEWLTVKPYSSSVSWTDEKAELLK